MLPAGFSQQAGGIDVLFSKPTFHGMSRTFYILLRSFPERRSDTGSDIITFRAITPRLQANESPSRSTAVQDVVVTLS